MPERKITMLEMIQDVKKALDGGAFISALALALTFPDICGRVRAVKLGLKNSNDRHTYINWFNECAAKYFAEPQTVDGNKDSSHHYPMFDGNTCYALRCAVLHSGNTNLKEGIKVTVETDNFDLCIYGRDQLGLLGGSTSVLQDSKGKITKYIRLDVRAFCFFICLAAEDFYSTCNPEDFQNNTFRIIDMLDKSQFP